MTIIPLPHAVASLWPIPWGLMLQRGSAEKALTCSSSSANELPSLDCNNLIESNFPGSFATLSHFSLQHPLEELRVSSLFSGLLVSVHYVEPFWLLKFVHNQLYHVALFYNLPSL